jgi:hypothetical protein
MSIIETDLSTVGDFNDQAARRRPVDRRRPVPVRDGIRARVTHDH